MIKTFPMTIQRTKIDQKFAKILLNLIIFLLPYDAINFLPSIYRPLSLLPLILLVIILIPRIFSTNFDKSSKLFLLFYFFIAVSSFLLILCGKLNFNSFMNDFITLTIGLLLFLTCNLIFRDIRQTMPNKNFKVWFAEKVAIAYYIPLIITVLDCLSIYNILPLELSELIHGIFGGWQNRLCGVSSEASWLVMHMAFCGSFYLYLFKMKKKKSYIFCALVSLLMIVLSVSLNGYIIVALALAAYWIYLCREKHHVLFWLAPILLFGFIFIFFNILQSIDSQAYYLIRFQNLSLSELYHSDISVFVRLTNPFIGCMMGLNNCLIGVGLGGYANLYGNYIHHFFPWVLNVYGGNNEVVTTIALGTANTKNLFANLISCGGVLSIIYFIMIFNCYKKLKTNKDMVLPAIVVFCCTLQFDSLCFFLWIVMLAFINNLSFEKNDNGKRKKMKELQIC